MHDSHGFNWLGSLAHAFHAPIHVVTTVFVIAVLMITTLIARAQLVSYQKNRNEGLVPEKKLTFRNFFEIMAEQLFGLCENVMGRHEAEQFFPVIGGLFVFIFASNLLGLIPGFLPPTDNLNTTLALGAFVFLYYNFSGLKAN